MKKLNTSLITSGVGYPPSKKGWDFLMESYTEMGAMMVKTHLGESYAVNTPYALWGCDKSNASSPFAYSAGAIFYNGEVYEFPAVASIAIATSDVCTITTTADPTADPTEMTDASNINIHDVRAIVLSDDTAVTNNATQFNFSSVIKISDIWHEVGGTGEPAFENSWGNFDSANNNTLAFKKTTQGFVEIRGCVTGGTSATDVFILPEDYRPLKNCSFAAQNSSSTRYARVVILSTGEFRVIYESTFGDVHVDGIRFSLE